MELVELAPVGIEGCGALEREMGVQVPPRPGAHFGQEPPLVGQVGGAAQARVEVAQGGERLEVVGGVGLP